MKQLNNNSITSSNFASSSAPSPDLSPSATQRYFSSSPPSSTKSPHLSSNKEQGGFTSSSSVSSQSTPELASSASQSPNQDCFSPPQSLVATEVLSPNNLNHIDAVCPSTTFGNFPGGPNLLANLQDRSSQFKCDHCPKEFSRRCDLKYVS